MITNANINKFAVIAPEITGPPEDVSGPLHSDLALSCEAKGNPIPDIHWEFKGDNGNSKNLPSEKILPFKITIVVRLRRLFNFL